VKVRSGLVILVALAGLVGGCGDDIRSCGSGGEHPQCWVCPTQASYEQCCGLLIPIRSLCEQVCVEVPPAGCGF